MRRIATGIAFGNGLLIIPPFAKCSPDQLGNIVGARQCTKARNGVRIGKIPLIFCHFDEIANCRIAGPRPTQRGACQRGRYAILEEGANDRFPQRSIRGVVGSKCRMRRRGEHRLDRVAAAGTLPGSLALA